MPKPTKLHSKGKPSSIQKPCKVDKESEGGVDPEASARQFQMELCWCIQQLERSLAEKKGNEKQMQDIWKVLTILKNNNQPTIRKRQLMRTHFGDYRAKMAAEEKKLAKMASKMKITESPTQPKATFLRKSAFLTTGDNTFKFNFNLDPEQVDTEPLKDDSAKKECLQDSKIEKSINNKDRIEVSTEKEQTSKDAGKNFKFTFSDSKFKFNFDVSP